MPFAACSLTRAGSLPALTLALAACDGANVGGWILTVLFIGFVLYWLVGTWYMANYHVVTQARRLPQIPLESTISARDGSCALIFNFDQYRIGYADANGASWIRDMASVKELLLKHNGDITCVTFAWKDGSRTSAVICTRFSLFQNILASREDIDRAVQRFRDIRF